MVISVVLSSTYIIIMVSASNIFINIKAYLIRYENGIVLKKEVTITDYIDLELARKL